MTAVRLNRAAVQEATSRVAPAASPSPVRLPGTMQLVNVLLSVLLLTLLSGVLMHFL